MPLGIRVRREMHVQSLVRLWVSRVFVRLLMLTGMRLRLLMEELPLCRAVVLMVAGMLFTVSARSVLSFWRAQKIVMGSVVTSLSLGRSQRRMATFSWCTFAVSSVTQVREWSGAMPPYALHYDYMKNSQQPLTAWDNRTPTGRICDRQSGSAQLNFTGIHSATCSTNIQGKAKRTAHTYTSMLSSASF